MGKRLECREWRVGMRGEKRKPYNLAVLEVINPFENRKTKANALKKYNSS